MNRDCFCIPVGSAVAWARGEDIAGRALGAGPGSAPEPRARMDVGSGSLTPCQCAELHPGAGRDRCGQEPSLAGEAQGSCEGHEEALELFAEFQPCLKFCLQPSFFLLIHPGIYCFSFLLPAPDFWAALPQEEAFGRLRSSCHASKHPSGILPASRWIQPGLIPWSCPRAVR